MDPTFLAQSALGQRWHSTTFRLLSIYGVIFSLSVMVLLGYIGWVVTGDMEHETDVVMDWQLVYFDSVPDAGLADAIHRRIEHERMHANYYGLFAADGHLIAGDVLAYPSQLPTDRSGKTLDLVLRWCATTRRRWFAPWPSAARTAPPLSSRDLTHILRIRETIINALVGGSTWLAGGHGGWPGAERSADAPTKSDPASDAAYRAGRSRAALTDRRTR